jgi:hypothetical protein
MNLKLKRPESMSVRPESVHRVEQGEIDEYLTHCQSVALILVRIHNPFEADATIKRYLEITGVTNDGV